MVVSWINLSISSSNNSNDLKDGISLSESRNETLRVHVKHIDGQEKISSGEESGDENSKSHIPHSSSDSKDSTWYQIFNYH